MTPDTEDWLGTWWARAIAIGIAASTLTAFAMSIALSIEGLGHWTYLNVIGAAVPGLGVPSAGFDNLATPLGLILQTGLGAGAAVLYAGARRATVPWPNRHPGAALAEGLLFGALIYAIATRPLGTLLDPALGFLPAWPLAIAHLAYGALVAGLVALAERHETLVITFLPVEGASGRAQLDEQLAVTEHAGPPRD